jgi:hypothetical protein
MRGYAVHIFPKQEQKQMAERGEDQDKAQDLRKEPNRRVKQDATYTGPDRRMGDRRKSPRSPT